MPKTPVSDITISPDCPAIKGQARMEITDAVMIRYRTLACVVIGVSAAASFATFASAGEYVVAGAVNRIADRCAAQFGEGFVDQGNGVCGRHTRSHTRVYVSPYNAGAGNWSRTGTSNAAVTSTEGTSIVPGVPTQRLRVRGNLDSYSPFR